MAAWLPGCLDGCLAAWLPGCLAASPTGCLDVYLPGCLAAWPPGCLPAWLTGCSPAWLPGCLPAWLPSCLPASWLLTCLAARLLTCLAAWLLTCLAAWPWCTNSVCGCGRCPLAMRAGNTPRGGPGEGQRARSKGGQNVSGKREAGRAKKRFGFGLAWTMLGWTVNTRDKSLSAQFENTIRVTKYGLS